MATLTETAYYARKFVIWGILGLIALIFLRIGLGWGISLWKKSRPQAPFPPTVAFGKLPALKFPPSVTPSSNLIYTLETVEGNLPLATSTANVYFIPKVPYDFLALSRAKEFAQRLGFTEEPFALTKTLYLWQDPKNSLRTLQKDLLSNNFTLAYDFSQEAASLSQENLPSPQEAVLEAKNFLQNLDLYPPELVAGSSRTSFWRISGKDLLPALSLSEADAVRVDFFRAPLDNFPILPPFYKQSPIFFLFGGAKAPEKRVLKVNYAFWVPDPKNSATYPLKTPERAWEELELGTGFIASLAQNAQKIVIRKVYLAYLDSPEYQLYLQPIFVFEGDKEFVAYVPAIKSEWRE